MPCIPSVSHVLENDVHIFKLVYLSIGNNVYVELLPSNMKEINLQFPL